jgi:Tol biopolymer transport system component
MVYRMSSFPESTLSPDGRRFVAEITHEGRRVISVTDIQTGQRRVFPKPNRRQFSAEWMPNSRDVVLLTRDDYTPQEALYLLDTETGDVEKIFEAVLLRAALAPDKRYVAYSNESGLYLFDRETDTATRLVASRAYEPHFNNLTFSPDSSRLMYFAGWSNGAYRSGLFLYDIAADDTRQVMNERHIIDLQEAIWSPDGSHIALMAWTHTGADILIADPTGTIHRTIRNTGDNKGLFAWSQR